MSTLKQDVLHVGDGRYAKEVLLRVSIFVQDNITKDIRVVKLRRRDYAKVCESKGVGRGRTDVHIRKWYGGFFGVTFSSPLSRSSHLLLGREYTSQLFLLAPTTARLITRAFQLPCPW
jgi:hypothetical protein